MSGQRKKTVLSGIRPTGPAHLGNFAGTDGRKMNKSFGNAIYLKDSEVRAAIGF